MPWTRRAARNGCVEAIVDRSFKKCHKPGMAGRPRSFEPERVLAQAMDVFWQKGFEGTGIADLEQATALGRQSLYGAFGDKRALFAAVVDYYFAKVLKPGLIDVLDADGSPRDNLERVLAMWHSLALSPDFQGCLVGNAASDLRAHDQAMVELVRRKLRLIEDAFVRVLRRAVQAGEVRADLDVRATARSLVTTSQGLSVIAKIQREPAFVSAVIDSARKLLG
jgi:TetR/AcrR family transcriptional regulator, transcriptional repressor for nem operon